MDIEMKWCSACILGLLSAGCAYEVNVYHHFPDGNPVVVNNNVVQPLPMPSPAQNTGSRSKPIANRYSEIYLSSNPMLAEVRFLASDDSDNNNIIGKTPITLRLGPGKETPVSRKNCGKEVLFQFDKKGYKTEIVTRNLRCYGTEQEMEKNPNNINVVLIPIGE